MLFLLEDLPRFYPLLTVTPLIYQQHAEGVKHHYHRRMEYETLDVITSKENI
jgi:hypothetical protein